MARYISKASKKPKKSKVIIFLNIVIGMLTAFVIFFLIGFFSSGGNDYYSRKFGDSLTSYSIERGQYAQLINEYNSDYGAIGRTAVTRTRQLWRNMPRQLSGTRRICRAETVRERRFRSSGWKRPRRKWVSMRPN